MKPAAWVAAVAVALALTWVLWPREVRRDGAAGSPETAAQPSAPGAPMGRAGGAAATSLEREPGNGAPAGSAPELAQAPSERVGFIEVRVTARGMPKAARVRLYWRGPADRNTGQTDWRLAGAAE